MKEEQPTTTDAFPRWVIEVPILIQPTPDDLARLRVHAERVRAMRDRIGSIDIASDELVHLARRGNDAVNY